MLKITTTTPSLVSAAAALLLVVTLLFSHDQHFHSVHASQHLRSRLTRVLYDNDASHALFQPEKERVASFDVKRNNAMLSHIQSRRQRSNNRIEQVIGSLNKTAEGLELQHQTHQQSSATASIQHVYILPQSVV
jgi:hypothetical protein